VKLETGMILSPAIWRRCRNCVNKNRLVLFIAYCFWLGKYL